MAITTRAEAAKVGKKFQKMDIQKKNYKTVIFDLFGTVALWDRNKLPRFTWLGEEKISTLGALKLVLEAETAISFTDFHRSFHETNLTIENQRNESAREISSQERFEKTLQGCGLEYCQATTELAKRLSTEHMNLLERGCFVPKKHVQVIKALSESYSLAIVSNFDHAKTARSILARDGVDDYFSHIVISEEFGWRKPNCLIFEHALGLLESKSIDTLYVGDSLKDDVMGAKNANLDVAWVNASPKAKCETSLIPTYEIASIIELERALLKI
jgi:2-haloacid dehalogenase|tara:strand:+ start:919 stop:1734 length:816 start_codon:yes stop_codon:yes gene_type:complete